MISDKERMVGIKKKDLVELQVVPSVATFLFLSITSLAVSRTLKIIRQIIAKPVYALLSLCKRAAAFMGPS